jgi:ABC-type multidrug transport system fused ATPase/permease subunit
VATLSLYIGTLQAAKVTHNFLLTKVIRAPMEFFDQTPIGRIINRFSKDIEEVDSDLPATLRAFSSCLFGVLWMFLCIQVAGSFKKACE